MGDYSFTEYFTTHCKIFPFAIFFTKVPFGKLAFMPGHLIHTNEITVLLGDNWFAEVSAKDAIGISDRRVTGKYLHQYNS